MFKTIGGFRIEWTGIKRVLIHTGLVALATIVTYIISLLTAHNFGEYQAIATIIIGFIATFAEKFFMSYDVPMIIK